MNSAALRSVKSIDLFLLLAFRFSSAVTCAQPLAAQAPADGSEKFSPLASSRQNFLGPGVALRPPHADAILLCQKAKKWRGTRPGHFHSKGNNMQNIRLRTATDVLAAIPALLGFVPVNSVVMIALTGSPATLAFVARTDVIGADAAADYSTALEQAAVTSVIWVVVGAGPVAAAGLDQIEAAQRELDSRGIRSVRTLVAESLEIGAEWFDTNGEESGRTADPILSEVSMNRIMSGRQTSSSRAEIEARYREDTAADMDAARAAAAEQGEDFARNTITEIAAVVRNFEVPSLDLAARAGLCAAEDPHHRDAMIGIVTISPQAAADAFGTIATHLRGNYRVQILTLAGLAAYVDGDGAAAGIALDAASAIGVDPSLTTLLKLLDASRTAGIKPEAIAELATIGVEVARSMGIDLDTE